MFLLFLDNKVIGSNRRKPFILKSYPSIYKDCFYLGFETHPLKDQEDNIPDELKDKKKVNYFINYIEEKQQWLLSHDKAVLFSSVWNQGTNNLDELLPEIRKTLQLLDMGAVSRGEPQNGKTFNIYSWKNNNSIDIDWESNQEVTENEFRPLIYLLIIFFILCILLIIIFFSRNGIYEGSPDRFRSDPQFVYPPDMV